MMVFSRVYMDYVFYLILCYSLNAPRYESHLMQQEYGPNLQCGQIYLALSAPGRSRLSSNSVPPNLSTHPARTTMIHRSCSYNPSNISLAYVSIRHAKRLVR